MNGAPSFWTTTIGGSGKLPEAAATVPCTVPAASARSSITVATKREMLALSSNCTLPSKVSASPGANVLFL